MHRVRLVALLTLVIGSTAAVQACAPPPPPQHDAVAPTPTKIDAADANARSIDAPAVAEPHACGAADECVASCSQGAVNRRWYARMFPGGEACEDGCAGKGSEAPRCEGGRCVAIHQGEVDPMCTGRTDLVKAPLRPGPAHRCRADDECRLSCTFGAVNTSWYTLSPAQECRDGCASKGMSSRCEDGRCVALREGQPYPPCTERSIHGDAE